MTSMTLSTPDTPLAPGGFQSGTGALQDQLAVNLGQARHYVEEEAPGGRWAFPIRIG